MEYSSLWSVHFADLLKTACRDSDLASRWGGEEFMILLPDTTLLEALSLAERMRRKTEETVIIHDNQRIPITLSAGVSSVTKAGSLEALLKQVDTNLYLSKELGRNRITPGVRRDHEKWKEPGRTRQNNDPQLQ